METKQKLILRTLNFKKTIGFRKIQTFIFSKKKEKILLFPLLNKKKQKVKINPLTFCF